MIRHIVMWNVRADTAEERQHNIKRIRDGFEGLRGSIPGLLHLEIGVDVSRIDYACDVVLFSNFDSHAALRDYAIHPEHLRVRDALAGVRTERYQVDYVVDESPVSHQPGRELT